MANSADPDQLVILLLSGAMEHKKPGPEVIKTFFMLDSTEHENFPANKYENFHIYWQRKFHAQLCLAKKEVAIVHNWRFN